MCGIAGVVYTEAQASVDRGLVERMCESMRHRGPDGAGYVLKGSIGLGMRRLAVIDLVSGDQPIYNEDESIVVVFNGEIYNFQELREMLQGRGHRFRTCSDTEVIVHLYEEYGEACVERLRGMFAFALWDSNEDKLVLARDRLGVKPLYYYSDPQGLRFGSEIKAILQDRSVPRLVNLDGIDQMFTWGFMIPPATCFQGVRELPPACLLTCVRGRINITRYWDLHFAVAQPYDEESACEDLLRMLREAVRIRMISDVPLGAFLSGGIDSSLIVALMSEFSERPVKTFSIGFDEPTFSELPWARQVAEQYRTEHHEFVVKPDVPDILPKLVRHHDTPFYDSSAIPTYYLSQMARQHVTVALSGDGGDELFAGYNVYLAAKAARLYQRVPRWARERVLAPLCKYVPESTRYINTGRVVREFTHAAALDPDARYARWASKVKAETRAQLYADPYLVSRLSYSDGRAFSDLLQSQEGTGELARLLYLDTKGELPGDILVKIDRMSMATSLEVRSPLLDHPLFEFAASLPDRAKLKGWTTKFLLRKVASRYLPSNLLKRRKHGFSVPLDRWFRHELSSYVQEVLLDPLTQSRQYFRQEMVKQMLRSHMEGKIGYGREIWLLLTFEIWHRTYID